MPVKQNRNSFKYIALLAVAVFPGISYLFSQGRPPQTVARESPQVVSTPTSVVIYPDRALVTRTVKVRLEKGTQSIKVVNLPFDLLKESLRVGVESLARVKILSSDLAANYEPKVPESETANLLKLLETLQEERNALADRLKNLNNETRLLDSIEVKNLNDKNKEISINKFVAAEWAGLLDFYFSHSTRVDAAKREANRRLEEVTEKLNSVKNQIGQNRSQKIGTNQLQIALSSDRETEVAVKISYLVNRASWQPFYEIHTDDGKSVELHYMASIRQNTGESWSGVSITLTTAKPALGIDIAPAEPVIIYRQVERHGERARYLSKSKSPMAKKGAAKNELADGADSGQAYDEAEMAAEETKEEPLAAEYETSQVEQGLASASFQILQKSDIAGDNSQHNVMIAREKLEAVVSHKAVPYASETVFVSGKIKNVMTYPLLTGRANLFINNNYVGSAALKHTAPEESFSIPLGPDENVKVRYTKLRQVSETYGLGKKRIKTTYEYRVEIENLKNAPVSLDVCDRIPVSTDAEIKVELRDINPKNDNDIKTDRGILRWNLLLKSKEKKEIRFTYTVDYPEEYRISF